MNIINLDSLKSQSVNSFPYKWGQLNDNFHKSAFQKLGSTFPNGKFEHQQRGNSEKNYNMYNRNLVNRNLLSDDVEDLNDVWTELARELNSLEYREALGSLVDEDIRALEMDAIFWQYDKGCWLDSHVDKYEKLVTQIFYFNDSWEETWGGHLLILNSNDIKDIHKKITSNINSSAVIYRSDNSWHAVEEVDSTAQEPRKSLQVIFHKK